MINGYDHHSPSSLNLYAAQPAMWVLERILDQKQPVGPPAHRGRAVEEAVTLSLNKPKTSVERCCEVARKEYDTLTALHGDPRRDRYRAGIDAMVKKAIAELTPYGAPSGMQGLVEWRPDELKYPIVGYYDYWWDQHGIVLDLKTTERMPGEIKTAHARQVALYAGSPNVDARLLYVTPREAKPMHLENILAHKDALRRVAMTIERLLAASDDPQYFIDRTIPDVDSFYWSNPVARALAYKYWKI